MASGPAGTYSVWTIDGGASTVSTEIGFATLGVLPIFHLLPYLQLVDFFLAEQHCQRTTAGDLDGMPPNLLSVRGVKECLQIGDRGGPYLCHQVVGQLTCRRGLERGHRDLHSLHLVPHQGYVLLLICPVELGSIGRWRIQHNELCHPGILSDS